MQAYGDRQSISCPPLVLVCDSPCVGGGVGPDKRRSSRPVRPKDQNQRSALRWTALPCGTCYFLLLLRLVLRLFVLRAPARLPRALPPPASCGIGFSVHKQELLLFALALALALFALTAAAAGSTDVWHKSPPLAAPAQCRSLWVEYTSYSLNIQSIGRRQTHAPPGDEPGGACLRRSRHASDLAVPSSRPYRPKATGLPCAAYWVSSNPRRLQYPRIGDLPTWGSIGFSFVGHWRGE